MKKKISIIILIAIISILSAKNILHQTLPNGMEIAVKENEGNTSVGFYCFIKTGAVNEGKHLGKGISHYLEHVVSGGTTKFRTEAEYEALGKEMGSIINAYTTNIATAFHIITDKKYADQALDILYEQVQFCAFDSVEVAREKQVILKEIVMRSSPARSKIYQRNNELVYPNSNNKYPVIGYPELFKTISRNELADYYHQRYVPNNMIFVAVGDFEADEMMEKVVDTFKDLERDQIEPVYEPVQNIRAGNIEHIEEFEIQQPQVRITTILPQSDADDEIAIEAALDILFSKRKSPINYLLVEELKLVNYIYSYVNITPVSSEGTINIVFEAKEPAKVKEIVRIIDEEIAKYCQNGFSEEQITNIINRKKAQRLLSTPGIESECNRIGWAIMLYGVPDTYEMNMALYESLKPAQLSDALSKHLIPKNRVVFYAVPVGTKAELEISEVISSKKTDAEKIVLNKNLTLIHKENTEKPIIKGVIYFPISDDYETIENFGTIEFMTDLMFRGSEKYESLDLSEWKEDHAVSFDNWINRGFYLSFKCLKDDYPVLKSMIFDAIENPSFTESELQLAKDKKIERYKRGLSRATNIHNDFRSQILYDNFRDGISDSASVEIIKNISREEIQEIYRKYFNSRSAIVTFFGDLDLSTAKEYAEEILDIVPDKKINEQKNPLIVPELNETFINEYPFEQVNIDLNFIAPKIDDEDFKTMKVIESIFSGSRGRIHKAVRGNDQDLAYFGFATYTYADDFGYFRITSQTSIDKKDELIDVLKREVTKLKEELVSPEEILSAIEEHQKIMNSYMNDNSLPFYMTHYEALGLGHDYLRKSSEILKDVTAEDIQRVANKYFKNTAVFVSVPDENVKLLVD